MSLEVKGVNALAAGGAYGRRVANIFAEKRVISAGCL